MSEHFIDNRTPPRPEWTSPGAVEAIENYIRAGKSVRVIAAMFGCKDRDIRRILHAAEIDRIKWARWNAEVEAGRKPRGAS